MAIEYTEYERPRRLASTTTMARGQVRGVLTTEPVGSTTRMRWDWNLPLGWNRDAGVTAGQGDRFPAGTSLLARP